LESHPIENLMKSMLENLKDMIDVNTVVGDPIKSVDGTTIIPISRVSLGFVSGGSEFCSIKTKEDHENYPFGGGTGSGISVKPVAFLVIKDNLIRLLPVDQNNINIFDRILEQIPQFIDMFKKTTKADKKCKDSEEEE